MSGADALATTRTSSLLSSGSTAVAAQSGGLRLGFLLASGVALTASLVAAIALPRRTPIPSPRRKPSPPGQAPRNRTPGDSDAY